MKKLKRLLSALLTVCLMFGSLVGLSVIEVGATADAGAAGGAEKTEEVIDYTTKVFATSQEKLASMQKKLTKDGFELWVDDYTGEVAIVNVATGQILFTNPYDVASTDAANSASTREELLSQVIVKYVDQANNGVETTFLSYTRAALNNQIKVKNIKNGIRVEYTIGREETKYLVPRTIEKERFETMIYNVINEQIPQDGSSEAKNMSFLLGKLKSYYTLIAPSSTTSESIKNQYYADYPITKTKNIAIYVFDKNASAKELTTCESIIKSYCPEYSYEELDKDHEMTEYTSSDQNPPLFKLALEYTLNTEGVTVRFPVNGLRFDESLYQLNEIRILPYMGAGAYTATAPNTGYTFFPDGSGSLFRFEDLSGSYSTIISGQIYGQDYAYHTISGTHQEIVRYPVFGVVQNTEYVPTVSEAGVAVAGSYTKNDTVVSSGYVAILEEGEALASIYTNHVPNVNKYHTIQTAFNPRPKDSYILADAISVSGSTTPIPLTSERKYTGDFQIKYVLLSDETLAKNAELKSFYKADWLGMKDAYSDYLMEQGVLTRLQESSVEKSVPLYIETFGTLPTTEKILSVPVTVMTPLTSFEDIQTMYDDLTKVGITNVNFKLTGYANGGMYSTVPYGLKWEKAVGGKKGFEELLSYAKDMNAKDGYNLGIFPDFDFVYVNNTDTFDGVSLDKHAAKTIDNRYTSKRVYSATYQGYIGYFDLVLSPAYFNRFYEKLTSNYLKYSIAGDGSDLGISVSTLASDLNSDFDEDEPYNREDSKKFTVEAFKYLDENYGKVMAEAANAYTWKYLDYMLNAPLDSSRFLRASNSVPFVGYVLHGFMQYAGSPINMEGDIQYALLKSIENGASLYFTLSYQNTTKLKDFSDLSNYYSVRYDIWVGAENDQGDFETGQLVDLYKELNEVTADLQTKLLINHEFLAGERIPDEDEAEADRLIAEEAKAEAEKQEALTAEQQKAANILEAKTTALATAKTALEKAKTLLADFDALLAKLEADSVSTDLTDEIDEVRLEAIELVKTDLKAVLNKQADLKAQIEIVESKEALMKEVNDLFVKEGTYSAAYLADFAAKVTEASALKAEAATILATVETHVATAKTSAAKADVKVEDVQDADAETPGLIPDAGTAVTPSFNKYYVDDGSLVAVTYGGKNGVDSDPYRTFILNYNYYAVTVNYGGSTYEIQPYDYAVINY